MVEHRDAGRTEPEDLLLDFRRAGHLDDHVEALEAEEILQGIGGVKALAAGVEQPGSLGIEFRKPDDFQVEPRCPLLAQELEQAVGPLAAADNGDIRRRGLEGFGTLGAVGRGG